MANTADLLKPEHRHNWFIPAMYWMIVSKSSYLRVIGTQEALDEMGAVHPIGRIGRPEEIADAVAWLFSDRSSYYTGQSVTLDGGLTGKPSYVTQPANGNLLQNEFAGEIV